MVAMVSDNGKVVDTYRYAYRADDLSLYLCIIREQQSVLPMSILSSNG